MRLLNNRTSRIDVGNNSINVSTDWISDRPVMEFILDGYMRICVHT